ncbi:MAG: hypothetical protein KBC16_03770 [Candidatus Pacebacteria bacterium]|nr:hypothetical protein [Candidatus Paceibacterota bacterium]
MSKFFITTLVAFMLIMPFTASAATANFFGPIISPECNCEGQGNPNGAPMTTAPDYGCVLQTVQNIINLTISISVMLAVFMIALTSFQFMTSVTNPEAKTAAKQRLISVLVGMLLLLSAWLIVDFVMKSLYNPSASTGTVELGPWNSILNGVEGSACIEVAKEPPPLPSVTVDAPTPGDTTTPGGTGGTTPGQISPGQLTHAQALAQLQAAGIGISSSGNCSDRTNSRCTSLDGIRADTVAQVVAVKNSCSGCSVTVTGGTETGHSAGTYSHGTGYKIDLRVTTELDTYFQGMTRSGSRGGDPRYIDRCGNEYVKEGSPRHWDITVTRGVCSPPK